MKKALFFPMIRISIKSLDGIKSGGGAEPPGL